MKKIIAIIILIVLLAIGAGIVGYPFISNYLMSMNLDSEIQTYLNSASQLEQDKYDNLFEEAKKYNESLIGNFSIGDPFGDQTETDDNYNELLDIQGTSVMACIEIPVIDVYYPIYHGTSSSILSQGIGHLRNTSLPIGGTATHSVLTGHTGLSSAKLFTDIDKLETGDIFYIHVLDEILAYEVDQIKVVEPSDTSYLQIDPEKDYVTLVTCTPYGINSHRLLVRGSRIPYVPSEKEVQAAKEVESTYNNEYMSAIIIGGSVMAGILIVYFLISFIIKQKRKRKGNE